MLIQKNQPADQVLDALGHQTRRDILALLKEGPLSVGSIAAHLPISRPAVSKHLRILQGAGLVAHNARGTRNIFYLRPDGFFQAGLFLEQFWDESLANFQRIAAENDQSEP